VTDSGQPTARATLAQLLEVLQAAVESVLGEPQQYKADARAGIWIREEIEPLIKTLVGMVNTNSKAAKCSCVPVRPTINKVDMDCLQHGTLTLAERISTPCPLCDEGEELTTYPRTFQPGRCRPLGASFSCGHWISFPRTEPSRELVSTIPMNSGGPVYPSQSAQITIRPQRGPFRPQRIVIGGANPADWLIDDIRVGNRSQMGGRGPLDGAAFGPQGIDGEPLDLDLEVIQTAMDFWMIVRYIGTNPLGEEFRAMIVGVEAR
jgi:hypothetical protein